MNFRILVFSHQEGLNKSVSCLSPDISPCEKHGCIEERMNISGPASNKEQHMSSQVICPQCLILNQWGSCLTYYMTHGMKVLG